MKTIGALEAGGTKMLMAVYDEFGNELERNTIPTRMPATTLPTIRDFFEKWNIVSLGIGSFGPVDLNPKSSSYGSITSTPKIGWKDTQLVRFFQEGKNIPVGFDTDVNAAAIAEHTLGSGKDVDSLIYVTIGTGIGAGIIIDGKPVHGQMHPEVGHMLLKPSKMDTLLKGVCPFHESCLEGLASGTAISARLGYDAGKAAENDPVFDLEAEYLAQMCYNLTLTTSPQKIILGGGVMMRQGMLPAIRKRTIELLNGYISIPQLKNGLEEYLVMPALYPVSGLLGAYLLGLNALKNH